MRLNLRSIQRLSTVKPELYKVVLAAADITTQPFMVTEGLRTSERQAELWAQGRTKPGPIVTWTQCSKHQDGSAVDLAPLKADGSIAWSDLAGFDAIARAMFAAAKDQGVAIRWGADWDGDGQARERGETDSPHFELV